MAKETITADEKAEIAIKLWEGLAGRLIAKGIITADTAGAAMGEPLVEAAIEGRADITRYLDAILRRLNGLPDRDPEEGEPDEAKREDGPPSP